MMFLLIIKCGGRGVACATTERIKGCISRADDTIVQNCEEILVNTKFPNEFVTAFYADGFDNRMEIRPCVE